MKLIFQFMLMSCAITVAVCQLVVSTCFFPCPDCEGSCSGSCCDGYTGCCGSNTYYASELTWVNAEGHGVYLQHKQYSKRVSDSYPCMFQIGSFTGSSICQDSNPGYSLSGVDYTLSWSSRRDEDNKNQTSEPTVVNVPTTVSLRKDGLIYLVTRAPHNFTEADLAGGDNTAVHEFVLENYDKVYNVTADVVTTRN